MAIAVLTDDSLFVFFFLISVLSLTKIVPQKESSQTSICAS